ncbi:MAG: MBL fold metallo-hydrolase [Bacteroidetes bacterium]|nr:MBL fold metallo-hydrolase [Bacteroidota bacterium]
MYRLIYFFGLFILPFNNIVSQETDSLARITYIANEGFLVETTSHKLIIDGLFGNLNGDWCEQPGDSISDYMMNGTVPFNDIEILLVTHNHTDHFNEAMVTSFMVKHTGTVLICPEQVNEVLKVNKSYPIFSERIISTGADMDSVININGVKIVPVPVHHGSYMEIDTVTGKSYDLHSHIQNNAYILKIGGFTLFHSGDGSSKNIQEYKGYFSGNDNIDIAMMDKQFLRAEGMQIINELIKPENLILMHIAPSQTEYFSKMVEAIPEIFVFKEKMESKIYKKDN